MKWDTLFMYFFSCNASLQLPLCPKAVELSLQRGFKLKKPRKVLLSMAKEALVTGT